MCASAPVSQPSANLKPSSEISFIETFFYVAFAPGFAKIAKHRQKLLNYMLFLRITPTLPNHFINWASPIVDIPFHVFFLATVIGLLPASLITVRVSFLSTLDLH